MKRPDPGVEVIIVTGYGTIESAVDATKKGAFDYILKPFDNDEILVTRCEKIEESAPPRRERGTLRSSGREKPRREPRRARARRCSA